MRRSLGSCIRIDYDNCEVVLIENSTSSDVMRLNSDLAKAFGVEVLAMENKGSKAAALNFALSQIQSEYLVVVDADQEMSPSALRVLVREIESSGDDVVCVQTAQAYECRNRPSFWSTASCLMHEIFYAIICNLYEAIGVSPCLGTNFILRTSAIRALGGFPDYSLTEDTALTSLLHRNHLKVRYLNVEIGKGVPPESCRAYCLQQLRWAKGTSQVLKHEFPFLIRFPRLVYLIASFFLYYLLGLSILLVTAFGSHGIYHLSYAVAISSAAVFLYIVVRFARRLNPLVLLLAIPLQTPVHIWGILSGTLGRRGVFRVTSKKT